MRLIDADALMTFCNNLRGKSIDSNDIARFPIVDAVPLDKLCEFLVKCGADSYCRTCKQIMGECFTDGHSCGSDHFWKELLTKWMEGLDAKTVL